MAGPRSLWNGTLTFGLVNVPVKVFTAQESKSIHFHQVHLKDEARIEHRKVCPKDDKEVSSDEIVKGYELSDGGIVVLTKEEIGAAAGENAKLIDVETFVPDDQIDPIFYDKTYYLGAGEDGEDAFRLLRKALEETDKVGDRPLGVPRARAARGRQAARRRARHARHELPRRGRRAR